MSLVKWNYETSSSQWISSVRVIVKSSRILNYENKTKCNHSLSAPFRSIRFNGCFFCPLERLEWIKEQEVLLLLFLGQKKNIYIYIFIYIFFFEEGQNIFKPLLISPTLNLNLWVLSTLGHFHHYYN